MEKSEKLKAERKIAGAKMGLINKYPFYSLLLSHTKLVADEGCKSISCHNDDIIYLPEFVLKLDNAELQFVLMHLVMHLALGHPFRKQENYDTELFDLACDIVVNSNIINSMFYDSEYVRSNGEHLIFNKNFPNLGKVAYLTPDDKDGYYFTAEEVYKMLLKEKKDKKDLFKICSESKDTDTSCETEEMPDEKKEEKKSKPQKEGKKQQENNKGHNNGKKDKGKGKGNKKETADFDPDSDEELQELINSIKKQTDERREKYENGPAEPTKAEDEQEKEEGEPFDDHSYWQGEGDNEIIPPSERWNQRCVDLANVIDSGCLGRTGSFPAGIKRKLKELMNPILDWRVVLNDFIQEEVCDYSFAPPDKRLQDCPFFLPDFNDTEITGKKILFAVDCSGSMSNDDITQCYSEIYHAILQFNGKLEGYVGYFDSAFTTPVPFKDIEEFSDSVPTGGGGTDIIPIFNYVKTEMKDDPPVSIIILTDGGVCDMPPDDTITDGIPVLWVINNYDETPPWGKVIRMVNDKNNF